MTVQGVVFLVFFAVWSGGALFLGDRVFAVQRAYLGHFASDGTPLNGDIDPPGWYTTRAQRRTLYRQQADPELERMRQETLREAFPHQRVLWAWVISLPFLFLCAFALWLSR